MTGYHQEKIDSIRSMVDEMKGLLERFESDASDRGYSTESILISISRFYANDLEHLISRAHDTLIELDSLEGDLNNA